jgi:hypothetical protein
VKTGFVTDQIFPRRVIEDLLHNSSEILRNMSTPVVGANTIFLPLKGPLEMMRKSPLIFLYKSRNLNTVSSTNWLAAILQKD